MSITINGPRGYEFQYCVTVLVALSQLENITLIFVEKKGTEDAEIRLQIGGSVRTIDVQVKNGAGRVELKTLTEWLCHFEERLAVNNLLDRILSKGHFCLFVAAGRCVDATAHFVSKLPQLEAHSSLSIGQTWIDSLATELNSNIWTGATQLNKSRDIFCKAQGANMSGNMNAQNALRSLIIWEQVSEEQVDIAVNNMLNRKFKIPQSVTESVYLQLLQAVSTGRDTQKDILGDFKQIIATNIGEMPFVDVAYRERNEETDLQNKLSTNSILLLSGNTQSGKSELSRLLALSFYNQGYTYRLTGNIEEMIQFFQMNSSEDKICILEDPWGHIQSMPGSADSWRKLSSVIRNKRANHKLIVTSRSEIVSEMTALTGSASLQGHQWEDVTVSDPAVLKGFWGHFAAEVKMDPSIKELITNYLENAKPNSLLQIGQLHHLSRIDSNELAGKNTDQLLHLARQTSAEIAGGLLYNNPDAADMLTMICICADTITPVSFSELGYILSSDDTSYSIREKNIWSSGLDNPDPFPAYATRFTVKDDNKKILEYLQIRGFINVSTESITLSHPNYYEAGRYLFTTGGSVRAQRVLDYFKKALQCISPPNALHALKQFSLLEKNSTPEIVVQVYELAVYATDSVFPSVDDQAMVFLVGRIELLSKELSESLIGKLEYADTPASNILWHNGIPYVSENSAFLLGSNLDTLTEPEVRDIESRLATSQPVAADKVWPFLRNIGTYPYVVISDRALISLMQYPEIFIRKRTAYLYFSKQLLLTDTPMIDSFFEDEHPSVIYTCIRSAIVNWPGQTPKIKHYLSVLIKKALRNKAVAIRCNQFITTFSTEYKHDAIPWESLSDPDKKELWNLWAELYPDFVKQLPPQAFLNSGRFGNTMDEAFKMINQSVGMPVLAAWYDRLDYKFQEGAYPDEYEMALAITLFEFTDTDYNLRAELFDKMLQHSNTNFLLSTLKWVINYWEKMGADEKSKIIALISTGRTDQRWIRALLLFSYKNPPAEIQQTLLGDPVAFDKTPAEFIAIIDSGLLQDCLKVYFGKQPFWWLATQYRNAEFWQPVIYEILEKQIEPGFEYCLENLVSWSTQSSGSPWNEGQKVWNNLCTTMKDKSILTKVFIEKLAIINTSLNYSSKMCEALHNGYAEEGKEPEFLQTLADNIEMIQETGHREDFIDILGQPLINKILPLLMPDYQLFQGLQALAENPADTESFDKVIDEVLQSKLSVRISITIKFLKSKLTTMGLLNKFQDRLQMLPNKVHKLGEEAVKALRDKEYQSIEF